MICEIIENKILSVACSLDVDSFKTTKAIAQKTELVIPTFGIHPAYSNKVEQLEFLDEYLNESEIVGEIGLDYYWVQDIPNTIQEKTFEYILDHCHSHNKYCVIHTKGAEKRIAEILKNYTSAKPVIHWYSGSHKIFKIYLERNYYFTFGCEVAYSKYIRSLLSDTPLHLILAETDNPTAEKWLGGNEDGPILIKRIVGDIAKVKGKNFEDMNHIINDNSRKILKESGINFVQ